MKIIVKIGSQQLIDVKGILSRDVVDNLIDQIAYLVQKGHQVVLISSGAIATGRLLAKRSFLKISGENTPSGRQFLAAVGQTDLINFYARSLARYNMLAAQVLLSHQDFTSRRHTLNLQGLFSQLLDQPKSLAIVNENDSVAIEELMFTDNDQLAVMLAALLGAEKVIFLTNVEGVYDRPPSDKNAVLLRLVDANTQALIGASSSLGRGGMASKLQSAKRAAALSISAHICYAAQKDILKCIIESDIAPGTTILPQGKTPSSIKRWLSFQPKSYQGQLKLNHRLVTILKEKQRICSILPVGVESYSGSFERGDILSLCDSQGYELGLGLARYNHEKLALLIGKRQQPAIIHYNYLYIKD